MEERPRGRTVGDDAVRSLKRAIRSCSDEGLALRSRSPTRPLLDIGLCCCSGALPSFIDRELGRSLTLLLLFDWLNVPLTTLAPPRPSMGAEMRTEELRGGRRWGEGAADEALGTDVSSPTMLRVSIGCGLDDNVCCPPPLPRSAPPRADSTRSTASPTHSDAVWLLTSSSSTPSARGILC